MQGPRQAAEHPGDTDTGRMRGAGSGSGAAAADAAVLGVDGGSLGHRAWHALGATGRAGPWVAGGVVRMLASAWLYGPFRAVVLALDSATSLRRQRFPAYKAHRPPPDPALVRQLRLVGDVARDAGFTVLEADGYEADDLLAGVARAARGQGVRCALLSSDRDLLAHVGDGVVLLRPRRSMSDLKVYDRADVEDEFGVPPERYRELAALRGDPADSLEGVPGVGMRTAARLLTSFGSLTALYEGVHHLDPPLRRALLQARPVVDRNLRLMRPLGGQAVDIAGVLTRGLDVSRAAAALSAAGLGRAATAFRLAVERPLPPPPPPPPVTDTTDYGRADRLLPPPRRPSGSSPDRGTQVRLFEA